MTLLELIIWITLAALVLTGINYAIHKNKPEWIQVKRWWLTFLQNFCGAFFIFSGYVKAVDPKGTAYKMHDYFGEFKTHISALEGFWSFLSEYALAIALFMIILEIVLGVMLLVGYTRKLTAWLFFLIVLFFTFLTGFTYLTGYVPEGATFFEFGKWGAYAEKNMKVTDCGCFGDFIKLKPRVTFMKDLALLVPGILFLILYAKEHILFTKRIRNVIVGLSTVLVTLFCLQNTYGGLPMQDFRPFKNGVDVRAEKQRQEDEQAGADVFYRVKSNKTQETQDIHMDEYVKLYSDEAFKAEWEFVDQIREDVPTDKIYEFSMTGDDGDDITEKILNHEGYHLMAVAYQFKYKERQEQAIFQDSVYTQDTIAVEGFPDSILIQPRLVEVNEKEYTRTIYDWNDAYVAKYKEKVNPVFEAAEKDGAWVYGVTKPYAPDQIDDFRHTADTAYPFFTADDILLKTIVRSNPGVVLWKDGKIIHKWHIRHLPDYATIKEKYMK